MTSISTALSLVDPVGQAAARPAPSVAVSGDAGFDAIFARILDQRDQPASSRVADEQPELSAERLDRGERSSDAVTRRDRMQTNDRTEEMDRSAPSEPTAERTDAPTDDDVERPSPDEAAPVAGPVVVIPVAVAPVPSPAPTLSPAPGSDVGGALGSSAGDVAGVDAATVGARTPAAAAPTAGVAAAAPAAGVAAQEAGGIATEQSLPIPTETVADAIATLQTEGTVPAAELAVEVSAGAPAPGEAAVGAPTATLQTTVEQGPAGNGGQPGADGDGASSSGNGNQTPAGDAAALGQAAPTGVEVPVEPVSGPSPAVAGTGAADDASAPGPSSDTRGASSTVGSVTSSGSTTTERVEASTVRTGAPDAQRPVDGRLRDRFVGSGLGATMTVDLSDEGLGQLSLQAHQGGGALHVTLAAGETSTRELLLGQSATLRSELEASGTRLGSFDVTDQLPRDTGRDGAGDDSGDRGAADRADQGLLGSRSSTAAASRPPSVRPTASTGIDLLI